METSYVNEIIYKVVDNNIMKGGYPMSKFIENENKERYQIGGGTMCEIICSRFNDLVIPISIDSHFMKKEEPTLKSNKLKYEDEIDDEQFNKLLGKIGSVRKIINYSKGSQSRKQKSKIIISNTKKQSRKSSSKKK
jgi:hypothetical protein